MQVSATRNGNGTGIKQNINDYLKHWNQSAWS